MSTGLRESDEALKAVREVSLGGTETGQKQQVQSHAVLRFAKLGSPRGKQERKRGESAKFLKLRSHVRLIIEMFHLLPRVSPRAETSVRLRVLGSWTLVDLYHSTKVYLSISALNSNTSSGSRLNFDFESQFLSCSVDRFREAAVRVYLYLNEILDLEDQIDWKTLFFNMSGGEKDCEIAGGCQVIGNVL